MPHFPPVEATTDLCTALRIIGVHCPVEGPAKISQDNFLLPLLLHVGLGTPPNYISANAS